MFQEAMPFTNISQKKNAHRAVEAEVRGSGHAEVRVVRLEVAVCRHAGGRACHGGALRGRHACCLVQRADGPLPEALGPLQVCATQRGGQGAKMLVPWRVTPGEWWGIGGVRMSTFDRPPNCTVVCVVCNWSQHSTPPPRAEKTSLGRQFLMIIQIFL